MLRYRGRRGRAPIRGGVEGARSTGLVYHERKPEARRERAHHFVLDVPCRSHISTWVTDADGKERHLTPSGHVNAV